MLMKFSRMPVLCVAIINLVLLINSSRLYAQRIDVARQTQAGMLTFEYSPEKEIRPTNGGPPIQKVRVSVTIPAPTANANADKAAKARAIQDAVRAELRALNAPQDVIDGVKAFPPLMPKSVTFPRGGIRQVPNPKPVNDPDAPAPADDGSGWNGGDNLGASKPFKADFRFGSGELLAGFDAYGNASIFKAEIKSDNIVADFSRSFSELPDSKLDSLLSLAYEDLLMNLPTSYQSFLTLDLAAARISYEFPIGTEIGSVKSSSTDVAIGAFSSIESAVPEPSTWALAVSATVGLCVVGWRSRLRQRQSIPGLESSDCREGRSSLEFNDDSPAHCGW